MSQHRHSLGTGGFCSDITSPQTVSRAVLGTRPDHTFSWCLIHGCGHRGECAHAVVSPTLSSLLRPVPFPPQCFHVLDGSASPSARSVCPCISPRPWPPEGEEPRKMTGLGPWPEVLHILLRLTPRKAFTGCYESPSPQQSRTFMRKKTPVLAQAQDRQLQFPAWLWSPEAGAAHRNVG